MLTTHEKQTIEEESLFILENYGVAAPPVPIYDIIRHSIPGLKLYFRYFQKIRGFAFMLGNGPADWAITINPSYGEAAGRFTAAHEFKHILEERPGYSTDRGVNAIVSPDNAVVFPDNARERQRVDYFATCILMPESLVTQRWNSFIKIEKPHKDRVLVRASKMATEFQVSRQAMLIRLKELGLAPPMVAEELLMHFYRKN